MTYSDIEVPFHSRYCCWFCGEPTSTTFYFPVDAADVLGADHMPLAIPSCAECNRLAKNADGYSIWHVRQQVKKMLRKLYQKDLAIGVNWTEEEIKQAGFDDNDKIFGGFKKSAWKMYEIAKERVNYKGWAICANGIDIDDETDRQPFSFDGVTYPDLHSAICHYAEIFTLNPLEFKRVVNIVSVKRFAYAIRFCRIMAGESALKRKKMIADLYHQFS